MRHTTSPTLYTLSAWGLYLFNDNSKFKKTMSKCKSKDETEEIRWNFQTRIKIQKYNWKQKIKWKNKIKYYFETNIMKNETVKTKMTLLK